MDEDGEFVLHGGEPYTGEVVELREDGSVITLYTCTSGYYDGPYRETYPDGGPYKEGVMRMGLSVGLHRRWHPSGRLAREDLFDERGHVARREWDVDGALLVDTFPDTP
ncbi:MULTISPECIES: hypothetical protein [Actinosynnema]|uniref:hypothetical protein n=1 Tax=Actinosynnema TaxID=40566 RepID=UPI0020A48123|nr:hypothetical protein [Actinosynnema pretiosum]MCP2094891.1 hypothetical protein [Actinosynnema pretiosum]